MTNQSSLKTSRLTAAKFVALMSSIYSCFYDDWSGEEDAYKALVKQGDAILKNEDVKPFVLAVIKERGDYISSDRECAAFAAAFNVFAGA